MSNDEVIPPSADAMREALDLSANVLRELELGELPLSSLALKAARIARLLNDDDAHQTLIYEVSGYPSTPTGVPMPAWNLGENAGRAFESKDAKTGKTTRQMYTDSIGSLEASIEAEKARLAAAVDRDISVSSSNPNQVVVAPAGNTLERRVISESITRCSQRLEARRAFVYSYVLGRHYELKFSGVVGDIFARVRERVNLRIGEVVPGSVRRFTAIYDNLQSANPEDWSNAVHGCRRILVELADSVFPPTSPRQVGGRSIALGAENYVNRLMAYVEDHSESARFRSVVGGQLSYLGERLDSVVEAANSGTHSDIMGREEADRYVVYTYLLVGDLLSLSVGAGEDPAASDE